MIAKVSVRKIQNIDDANEIKDKFNSLIEDIIGSLKHKTIDSIIIKVNICYLRGPETGITTDPVLVRWLCEWLFENCEIDKIYIAESDATHLNAQIAFKALGWERIFGDMEKVELLNLSKDEQIEFKLNGLFFKKVNISKKLFDADLLISFGKLKTHSAQTITCIMKNQFGMLSEKLKMNYHSNLAEAIVDSVRIRPPDICLIDGLIGHQGPGPVSGIPILSGLLIGGTDAVATDMVCAQLMGINPLKVPHIRIAVKNEIGARDYEVLGVSIKEGCVKFQTIPLWKKWAQTMFQGLTRRRKDGGGLKENGYN
ncbi:MAG: DUF362 domain-containing protein [bacterium]